MVGFSPLSRLSTIMLHWGDPKKHYSESAKKDGSWTHLESTDRLEMPKELSVLLKKSKKAEAFYESMTPSSKKLILEWIKSEKTEETKMRRNKETVRLALMGIRANHYVDLKKLKK